MKKKIIFIISCIFIFNFFSIKNINADDIFEKGKQIVNEYIEANPKWEMCQLFISDPMTVGIYPQDSTGAEFNEIVLQLEALGFYGKAAGYKVTDESLAPPLEY